VLGCIPVPTTGDITEDRRRVVSVSASIASGIAWGAGRLAAAVSDLARCNAQCGRPAPASALAPDELISAMHRRMVEVEERCAMLEERHGAMSTSLTTGAQMLRSRVEGIQQRLDVSAAATPRHMPMGAPASALAAPRTPWSQATAGGRAVAFIPTSALREAARAAPDMEDSWVAVTGIPLPEALATPGAAYRATSDARLCREALQGGSTPPSPGPGASDSRVSFLFASPAPRRGGRALVQAAASARSASGLGPAPAPGRRSLPFAPADLASAAKRLGPTRPGAPPAAKQASSGAAPRRAVPFGAADLAAAAKRLAPGDAPKPAASARAPAGGARPRPFGMADLAAAANRLNPTADGAAAAARKSTAAPARGNPFSAEALAQARGRLRRADSRRAGAPAPPPKAAPGGSAGRPALISADVLAAARERLRAAPVAAERPAHGDARALAAARFRSQDVAPGFAPLQSAVMREAMASSVLRRVTRRVAGPQPAAGRQLADSAWSEATQQPAQPLARNSKRVRDDLASLPRAGSPVLGPRSPNVGGGLRKRAQAPAVEMAARPGGVLSPELLRNVRLRRADGEHSPGGTPARRRRPAAASQDQAEFFKRALQARFGRVHAVAAMSPASAGSDSSFDSPGV